MSSDKGSDEEEDFVPQRMKSQSYKAILDSESEEDESKTKDILPTAVKGTDAQSDNESDQEEEDEDINNSTVTKSRIISQESSSSDENEDNEEEEVAPVAAKNRRKNTPKKRVIEPKHSRKDEKSRRVSCWTTRWSHSMCH